MKELTPDEVEQLLATYRAHRRPLGEDCGCEEPGRNKGADARHDLWQAGINPDHHRSERSE